MRFTLTILLGLYIGQCISQDYDATLSLRLSQIKEHDIFRNRVFLTIDSVDYNDLSFPYWKAKDMYYEGDMTRYNYRQYTALKDTKGQRPDTARTAWRLQYGPHPSLFFRDTARTEDLKHLLYDNNKYVRLYAFCSLSFRKEKGLFSIITDNLADTTEILAKWSDAGYYAHPADLMIECEAPHLMKAEKKKLKGFIKRKYHHLKYGLEILERE